MAKVRPYRKKPHHPLQLDVLREAGNRPISGDRDVVRLLLPLLAELPQEVVLSLSLSARGTLTAAAIVAIGTLAQSLVHPRDVFREAILHNAGSLILVHNHPSGDPQPSLEDQLLTDRLSRAGQLLGIPLVDHIILGRNSHFSFAVSTDLLQQR